MIIAQNIVDRMKAALDAEQSTTTIGRYEWLRDFQPAINYAMEWMVSLCNSAFAKKKFTEENLTDLVYVRVWKTNLYSRFVFRQADTGMNLWTIVSVYPNPILTPDTIIPQPDLTKSVYAPTYSYLKSYDNAKRLTAEEVNPNRRNPFEAGNEVVVCPELIDYAYKSPTNYAGGYDPTITTVVPLDNAEIEILPAYANKNVAMEFLKVPTSVVNPTDNIEFPQSMENILFDKALNFITYKRGDSDLKAVTDEDVKNLASLIL